MKKRIIITLSILCVAAFLVWFSCNPFQHQDYPTLANYNILDETDAVRASDNWPLTGSLDAHDPAIIQENGGAWFVFGTGTGIQVKKSSDGLAWSNIGKVFSSTPSWVSSYISNFDGNIWAPDIHYYNGLYYLYYACSSFGSNTSVIGLATSSSLSSPSWSDKGLVIRSTSSNNYNCIDPNLVIDNSGNLWLAFGSFWSGIQIVQLDSSTMKPKSGAAIKNIATRSNTACEAAFIVYRSGYYYLFESVDTCCQGVNSTYKIMYGRSSSVNGTYVDKNGTAL
jgi:arabinan endo-1,5-alpha-L-arabinosidase